jgi:signal transduction histidine kinase
LYVRDAVKLYWRIVLPFTAGLVLVVLVGGWIATYLIGREADRRLETQLETVAHRILEGGFELNRPLLDRLKVAVGADVLVTGSSLDTALTTTLDDQLVTEAAAHAVLEGRGQSASRLRTARIAGQRYAVLAVSGPGPSPQTLAFFYPLARLEADRARVERTLALVATCGLALMFVWGHLITRNITGSIRQLVRSTRIVAGGDLDHRTSRPRIPELAALAEAFDHMVGKIRESEARLVRSERLAAMGQIVATVAHEVRNPLAAIRMLAQVLARYHAEATQPGEACRKIVAEIDRLEMLVTGLLDATHARPLRRESVDLAALLEEIAGLTKEQFAHRGIAVELAVPQALPCVSGDHGALKQLVLNLILNAADAMPAGGRVRITARPEGASGMPSGLGLVIEDGGTGLSGRAQELAFEAFFSTKPEGAGLGLAVCRRIVEEHGGRIQLANRAEGGAIATVWLPTSHDESPAATTREAPRAITGELWPTS